MFNQGDSVICWVCRRNAGRLTRHRENLEKPSLGVSTQGGAEAGTLITATQAMSGIKKKKCTKEIKEDTRGILKKDRTDRHSEKVGDIMDVPTCPHTWRHMAERAT